jgi:hypothetical protein
MREPDLAPPDEDLAHGPSWATTSTGNKIGITHEIGNEAIGGRAIELARGADLRNAGVRHDDDPVRDGERLFLISSSAPARSDCGMAKPKVLAILKLFEPKVEASQKPAIPWKLRAIADNGLEECSTGKS